jgi:MFS family permease
MKAHLVRQTKKLSLIDGAFWTGMVSFGEMLTMLYLAKVCTQSSLLAFLSTIPVAVGAVAQAVVPQVFSAVKARTLLLSSIGLQILGILIIGISFAREPFTTWILACGLTLYWVGGMTAGPPWQEMMAHLIPESEHNKYFSGRSAVLSIVNLGTNMVVGLMLHDRLDRRTVLTFVCVAFVLRLFSYWALWLHPKPTVENFSEFRINKSKLASTNVGNVARKSVIGLSGICLFMFVFRFGVNLAGPFFNPYMLNIMQLPLMTIFLISSIPLVTRVFLMHNWGTILDKRWVLEGTLICGSGIALAPALWTMSSKLGWITGVQIWSGVMWAGFEVLSVLVVQRLFPESIMRALGFTFSAAALGSAAGGLLGGYLLDFGLSITNLFWFSTMVRSVAVAGLMSHLRVQRSFRFRQLHLLESFVTLFSFRRAASMLAVWRAKEEKA